MRRVLIACPGYRDPFTPPGADVRPNFSEGKRTDSGKAILDKATKFRHGVTWNSFEAEPGLRLGPILTAIREMSISGWTPDTLIAPYVVSDDLVMRVSALQKVVPHLLGREKAEGQPELPYGFVALGIEEAQVAEYGVMYAALRLALAERLPEQENREKLGILRTLEVSDVRILVGPSTPALNFSLLLLPYSHLPKATAWQILDPRDLSQTREGLEGDWPQKCLRELKSDGFSLPYLQIQGEEPPVAKNLRMRIQELEAEVGELRAKAVASDVDLSSYQSLNVKEVARDMTSAKLRAAIAEEQRLALEEGRKPKVENAAAIYGTSRQTFQNHLKGAGINW